MRKHSEEKPDWQDQRNRIIGLGESSLRKSYYPELQQKMAELQKANDELQAAYEQLASSEEELRQNYDELNATERELRVSEEKYRNLIENSFDGIVIHKDTRIVFLNRTALRLFGIGDISEYIGRSIFTFIHPDFVGVVSQRADSSLRSVQQPLAEKFVRADGEIFDVEVVAGPTTWEGELAVQVAFRDITAQKQAEAALQESEQRYRTLVETTDTGFVIVDAEGRVVDANQKYVQLAGHRGLSEILGHSVQEWTADYEREKNAHAIEQCIREGFIRNFEVDYVDSSGVVMPVEISATVVPYHNTTRILTLCRDIRERRKAEQELRESEHRNAMLLHAIPDMMFVISRDGVYLDFSVPDSHVLAVPVDQILGKNIRDSGFGDESAETMLRHIRQALETKKLQQFEYELALPSEKHQYEARMVALHEDTVLGIIRDITERKQAEDELRRNYNELKRKEGELRSAKTHLEAIYEGSPDLIFVHAADGHIIDVNENVIRAFGFSSREEAISTRPEDTSGAGYNAETALAHIRTALETGEVEFFWVGKRKNGEVFPIEVRLRRIESVNERGETEPRVLAIVRDITEQRMAEKALAQARKKLGLLNTVIFQDIQSTIFALSAYLQLAGTTGDAEKARSYAEKQAGLIQRIVASLQFAKNYQDMGIHPPRWQNVNQVFLYALSHLDSLNVSRSIRIGSLEVFADPLLEKAIFNLIENALIHGERVTEITLDHEERDGNLILVFRDNGIGIPAADKKKIFERGYGKNAGLGLFLVREILSITGMAIEECGEEGTGACFEITIPKGIGRFV